jgi:hypothetical protein
MGITPQKKTSAGNPHDPVNDELFLCVPGKNYFSGKERGFCRLDVDSVAVKNKRHHAQAVDRHANRLVSR